MAKKKFYKKKENTGMTVEEAKEVIEELKAQGNTEEDIVAGLYQMFCDGDIDLDELKNLVELVGYELSEEFLSLSPEEQKTKGWDESESVDLQLLNRSIEMLLDSENMNDVWSYPKWVRDILKLGYYENTKDYNEVIDRFISGNFDISKASIKEVKYVISYIYAHERLHLGFVGARIEDGIMLKLLKRLKEHFE